MADEAGKFEYIKACYATMNPNNPEEDQVAFFFPGQAAPYITHPETRALVYVRTIVIDFTANTVEVSLADQTIFEPVKLCWFKVKWSNHEVMQAAFQHCEDHGDQVKGKWFTVQDHGLQITVVGKTTTGN